MKQAYLWFLLFSENKVKAVSDQCIQFSRTTKSNTKLHKYKHVCTRIALMCTSEQARHRHRHRLGSPGPGWAQKLNNLNGLGWAASDIIPEICT